MAILPNIKNPKNHGKTNINYRDRLSYWRT